VPDLSFVDSNCDGIDGTETDAVFASPLGDNANPGTKAEPKRGVQAAVLAAAADGKDVYAAGGEYGRVEAASGVGIYGGYGPETWKRDSAFVTSITGVPEGIFADGTDLEAVYTTAVGLVDRLRSGEGPFLLELSTVRIGGHYEGDAQPYRSDDVFARDPILRLRASLVERGIVGVEELVLVEYRIHAEIEAAFAFASASPYPDPSEVGAHV